MRSILTLLLVVAIATPAGFAGYLVARHNHRAWQTIHTLQRIADGR